MGPPGIGKTSFAEAFARSLGVPWRVSSLGSAQGAFELTGSARHWSTSTPGAVFSILAEGSAANPVLVLDEVDKMHGDDRCPTEHALVELLEPQSARRFRDQALDLEFDAGKLILVATANDTAPLSAPVLSRFEPIEVSPPTSEERRCIVQALWKELIATINREIELSGPALERAAKCDASPRELRRVLRHALGLVLRDGRGSVDALSIPVSEQRRIGF